MNIYRIGVLIILFVALVSGMVFWAYLVSIEKEVVVTPLPPNETS